MGRQRGSHHHSGQCMTLGGERAEASGVGRLLMSTDSPSFTNVLCCVDLVVYDPETGYSSCTE